MNKIRQKLWVSDRWNFALQEMTDASKKSKLIVPMKCTMPWALLPLLNGLCRLTDNIANWNPTSCKLGPRSLYIIINNWPSYTTGRYWQVLGSSLLLEEFLLIKNSSMSLQHQIFRIPHFTFNTSHHPPHTV